ncbi:hypothetical protein HanPSC8_Chr06g0245621 [Helianthus annuus]|nr:hypothetical protein HanPSC8_Chr06g0245621 [Helianthus annuus]
MTSYWDQKHLSTCPNLCVDPTLNQMTSPDHWCSVADKTLTMIQRSVKKIGVKHIPQHC